MGRRSRENHFIAFLSPSIPVHPRRTQRWDSRRIASWLIGPGNLHWLAQRGLLQFEPYDFQGLDPDQLGTPVRHLPTGEIEIEADP
jgi:hypothetical protein